MQTFESAHIEMRDCYLHDSAQTGSTSYGINDWLDSDSLFQNNIFSFEGAIIPATCSSDVIAYNFFTNILQVSAGWETSVIQPHGCHTDMNLYEGNVGSQITFDFIHGSSSHSTVFRNQFVG